MRKRIKVEAVIAITHSIALALMKRAKRAKEPMYG
jgi:hypothetical protein